MNRSACCLVLAASLALLLTACTTPEDRAAPAAAQGEAPPAEADTQEARPARIESQPLKHLVGRNLKPLPEREISVRTRCSFKDVQGGRGSMDLQVTKAEVKRFVAEVTIPKQGQCRFDMSSFEQTARLPHIILRDRSSACMVSMWQQERGVTVAFNSCQMRCSGDAFSYLWPILVDTRNGRCA